MALITVDNEKCVGCGACSEACLTGAIAFEDKRPKAAHDICIRCGHCVAVCPTAAIDNIYAPLKKQTPKTGVGKLSAEQAAEFLKGRVSVREYQNKSVPRDVIESVLDVARFALTGRNSQGISYVAIDNPSILQRVKDAVITRWAYEVENNPITAVENTSSYARMKAEMVKAYREKGRDTALWNAPCLVLAIADKSKALNPREAAVFSLTYAHLFAQSVGLGCCWAGGVEGVINQNWPDMIEALDMGDAYANISGALMIGYPKYKYRRLVDRESLSITWK